MKRTAFFTRCFAIVAATTMSVVAQSPVNPVGVWVGLLEGQPGTTLTLSDDTGGLGGTVVLNAVSGEGRILFSETHLVLNPRLTGKVLLFQVKSHRKGSNDLLDFRVVFNTDHTAQLHCENCGDDAPVAEMTKSF
jgi:hypothetical protein